MEKGYIKSFSRISSSPGDFYDSKGSAAISLKSFQIRRGSSIEFLNDSRESN